MQPTNISSHTKTTPKLLLPVPNVGDSSPTVQPPPRGWKTFPISLSLGFTGKVHLSVYIQHFIAANQQPWTAGSMGMNGSVIA
jgi:hypothetical protein